MQPKQYAWVAGVVGLVLGLGGWFLFLNPPAAPAQPGTNASSTVIDLGNGRSVTVEGGGTVDLSPVDSVPAPKVAPLVFAASVDAASRTRIQSQFAELSAELKKDPTRVDLWLGMGVLYKAAGQYAAAITAWDYVAKAGPDTINYIAYGNLGDLYLNFLKDYAKAEASYKSALAIKPGTPAYTEGLSTAQRLKSK